MIIGDVFTHPNAGSGGADGETDQAFAAWFSRNRWGRYVILFRDKHGALTRVFRDPSGSLAAHGWRAQGVQILTSEISEAVIAVAPPDVGFDWDRIRGLVERPFDLVGPSPLTGVTSFEPGHLADFKGASVSLWSPETFAQTPTRRAADARHDLRRTLDLCVSTLAGRQAVGIEISGGLDSAIVGGALKALGHPVAFALNTRAPRAETDERRYAQAVAAGMGVDLTCRLREAVAYSAERFEATAGDVWPSQNGRDLGNDQLVAGACQEAGVEILLTGKGGDALFFQMHTPLAFADLWWDRPLRSLTSGLLPGVARWTRRSTWSLIRTARESRRDAAGDLPPAKRLQIAAIASGLAYLSVCRRAEVVDMVHPLMAQPLVEWSLRTPVPHLVPNGRERGLAREAFADRLPASVATRQGKGDYAAYFNRQTAQNLPFLRTYLLEGRLAAEHVIDRALMEARLDEDALRWQGGASEILAAVSVEAWVRRWEGRRPEV
ncbi:asparagine synthase C-terminal domain-containing protein [Brevundimonas nasdae]|uniref:asparagine synthase C-terminal domain-containing protein n=1 Tax=Brevundimonas nasdae TaxID=172043 RepID=UPI003019E377